MIKELIAVLVAAAICLGVYAFGRHDGYNLAQSECQAASQRGELGAEHARYLNLRAQMAKQNAAITATQSDKAKVESLLAAAQERVKVIKVARDCTIGAAAIDALNSVRKAGAP